MKKNLTNTILFIQCLILSNDLFGQISPCNITIVKMEDTLKSRFDFVISYKITNQLKKKLFVKRYPRIRNIVDDHYDLAYQIKRLDNDQELERDDSSFVLIDHFYVQDLTIADTLGYKESSNNQLELPYLRHGQYKIRLHYYCNCDKLNGIFSEWKYFFIPNDFDPFH